MPSLRLLLSLVGLPLSVVLSHSWIECLDTDRSVVFDRAAAFVYGGQHAAGLCMGYQRDYRGRGEGIQDEDHFVKILKDDYHNANVAVCKPRVASSSASASSSTGFHKRLRVAAGDKVFFAYMPNGHVAKDKAARGTLHGLYWSGQPGVELQFTSDLTDDRLLAGGPRRDFDDGVCGQTFADLATHELSGRAGDDFPCVGEFAMPAATAPGVYAVVWMWKFWDEANDRREIETFGGKFGGAAYSSCFDVEVVAAPTTAETETETETTTTTPSYAPAAGGRDPERRSLAAAGGFLSRARANATRTSRTP